MKIKHFFYIASMLSPFVMDAQVDKYEEIIRYIENPSLVEENQLPPHVPFILFENLEQAKAGDWAASPWYRDLNGTWKFYWSKSPLESPREFHLTGFDASGWKEIRVPGTWQMQGYGYNIYRNVPMEFAPYDPPCVPVEFNPTGYYIREFEIPVSWKDRKVVLHFDGVKAGYWVWINGTYTGFDKGSMTPAEFDISEYLVPGTNKIAVQVVRWSDGSYLEDQDMWRFAGIYRGVYLYAVPESHISDFFVRTSLDDTYTMATLGVDCFIENNRGDEAGKLKVKARLFDRNGNETATFSSPVKSNNSDNRQKITLSSEIGGPDLWSAEKPNLYTLVLTLENNQGAVLEAVEEKVGFRELEIRNSQLLVNGVPIVIKGVNRHEHDMLRGRTMSRELIEKDFKLMKELNINGIRTSHYPNDPLFYELADTWGFYICNEVNAECHYGQEFLAAQPGWEDAFMDRTRRYLQRDKNHPSVIMWSMGNECGLAPIHYQMADYVHAADPTRFVYHQTNTPNGDAPFADICGTRYPNPGMLDAIGDTTRRPVILGEYAHAVANSMGHFDEYWDRFYKYDRLQGGFIWDWVNQSILVDLVTTPDRTAYHNQAVLMGRPEQVKGHSGLAIQLSGLDDFVEVTPHSALELTGTALTLQTWIYPRGFNGSNTMISKGTHSFSLEQPHKDTISFSIHTDKPYRVSAVLPRNWNFNWHHVAAIYDGSAIAIFLDGKKLASSPARGKLKRTYYEVMVGKNHEGDHENTPGFISNAIFDEVMIHNIALEPGMLSCFREQPEMDAHLALWLSFEEQEILGKFRCYGATPYASATMDGIIFADRTYQPESWQVKHSHCPVKTEALDPENGKFLVHNRYHFTNLNELTTSWVLLEDGAVIREGELELDVQPLQKKEVALPIDLTNLSGTSEYLLRMEYRTGSDQPWAKAGYEIGFDEFDLGHGSGKPETAEMAIGDPLVVSEDGDGLMISGKGFRYTFDRSKGLLSQVHLGNTDLLLEGPQLKVSRPPIVNEISTWTRAEYATWYEWGLDSLVHEVESMDFEKINDNEVLLTLKTTSFTFMERALQFNNVFIYRVFSDGTLVLDHTVLCQLELPARRPSNDIPWIQKIGLELKLSPAMEQFQWFGKGPFETYPDRKTGARTGIYTTTTDSIRMPYVISQGFGNHTDVRWLEVLDRDGAGLRFESEGRMDFSIDPYANLKGSWYPYQLKRAGSVSLNLDHRVSGVGGTPITVRHPYRTYPDAYHYQVTIRPVNHNNN